MKPARSNRIFLVFFAISLYWICTGCTMAKISNLEEIRNASQSELKSLYQDFRGEFGAWVQKYYNTDEELAGEIYQQAFIAFYYNIKDGKVTQLSSSLKTYLFAIGKNVAREQLRHKARFIPEEDNISIDEWDTSYVDQLENQDRQQHLKELLDRMGEPCSTVLRLYYFEDYSMASIATEMNYKTEQIAAKRKFICLQQIRKLLKETSYFNAAAI